MATLHCMHQLAAIVHMDRGLDGGGGRTGWQCGGSWSGGEAIGKDLRHDSRRDGLVPIDGLLLELSRGSPIGVSGCAQLKLVGFDLHLESW
jgi:hypothetical protein